MIDLYRRLRDLLSVRERRNALVLFAMMLCMGLLDTIGVASVMPFVSVLSNPGMVESNAWLAWLNASLGFDTRQDFLIFLGGAAFALVMASLVFKALTQWAMARYVHMRTHSISTRLLRRYLARPYAWYLGRNTSELAKSVLSEVEQVTTGVLMPALQVIAQGIVATFLVGLVVAMEPAIALAAFAVLGGTYALLYAGIRRYLSRVGAERVQANNMRFHVAQEAMGGIKEIKVAGIEDGYVRSFYRPAQRFARAQANNQIAGQLPPLITQGIAFGGLLLVLLALLALRGGDLSAVLPTIALFAFAATRLNPALQKTYRAMTKLRFGKPALVQLHADMFEHAEAGTSGDDHSRSDPRGIEPLRLRECLELRDIGFHYPGTGRPALDGLSLSIPAHTTVGLVGTTGAGKTTLVDVILGLLVPQSGEVLIDGVRLTQDTLRRWQRSVGYVPQHIYLTDDTIARNIAFGVPSEQIDPAAVEKAARLAELHEFVVEQTDHGYETIVGERGVRLSGGQRQRIGIARALYHDPDVLVLDEATSALDSLTERTVMRAVHNLSHRKTIILIAHRLTTVQACDRIFLLHHGRVADSGSYDDLYARNERFRGLAVGGS